MEEELEEVRGLAGTVDPSLCRCSDSHEQKKGESTLSDEAVRFLQDINQDVAANVFSDVTRRGPVVLMEEACSPERRQSAEVQRITGQEGSAIRCSQWSGSDLSTGDGVKLKLQLIDHHRPMQLLMRDQGFERVDFVSWEETNHVSQSVFGIFSRRMDSVFWEPPNFEVGSGWSIPVK